MNLLNKVDFMDLDPQKKEKNFLDEDSMLMLELASGSDHAMRMIVEKWKNPLINFFYKSVHNLSSAEDLAQQTFINIYKAKNSYVVSAKFSTYIFGIARNLCINEFRKNSRRPQSVELIPETDAITNGREDLEAKELEELFTQALEGLPENQRTAILLLKQQELSYDQIAEIMQTSTSSVKTWIHRARQSIKEKLESKI